MTASSKTVEVRLGKRIVQVPAAGLYNQYGMNTDLDAVANNPFVSGVDFFKSLSKTKVHSQIRQTHTRNFYYAASLESIDQP